MDIKEIKTTELEAKISDIDMSAQFLHEDIKEPVEELKNVDNTTTRRRIQEACGQETI